MGNSDIVLSGSFNFQELAEAIGALIERLREAFGIGTSDEFEDFVKEIESVREKPEYPIITAITAHSTGLRSETVTRVLIPL